MTVATAKYINSGGKTPRYPDAAMTARHFLPPFNRQRPLNARLPRAALPDLAGLAMMVQIAAMAMGYRDVRRMGLGIFAPVTVIPNSNSTSRLNPPVPPPIDLGRILPPPPPPRPPCPINELACP